MNTAKEWPTNERIENIGVNGNNGEHYALEAANDVGEVFSYFVKDDEIKALKKENEELKKRLHREIKAKSKWKGKFEKVRPARKSIRTKKNQKAIDLIAARENGDKTYSLADIGRLLDIRYSTLKNMAYMYRQSIKESN